MELSLCGDTLAYVKSGKVTAWEELSPGVHWLLINGLYGAQNRTHLAPLAANDESASPMAVKGIGNWDY